MDGRMSEQAVCGSCHHWKLSADKLGEPPIGVCRRYPPVPVPAGTSWPMTYATDTCGEYKAPQWIPRGGA